MVVLAVARAAPVAPPAAAAAPAGANELESLPPAVFLPASSALLRRSLYILKPKTRKNKAPIPTTIPAIAPELNPPLSFLGATSEGPVGGGGTGVGAAGGGVGAIPTVAFNDLTVSK